VSDPKEFERKIGLSQTISPFGVGAIYDYRGESLVAADTRDWKDQDLVDVPAARLAAALGVARLRKPKTVASLQTKTKSKIPYARFPRWLFCARCRRLGMEDRWGGGPATCGFCKGAPQLVPMRFVVACVDGHMGDVDWARWAHKDHSPNSCKVTDLKFEAQRGAGTGLASLVVRCQGKDCGASSSLEGITSKGALKAIGQRCPGTQPWQSHANRVACQKPSVVVQRGASNLYFSEIESALEIPGPDAREPAADEGRIRAHVGFAYLQGLGPEGPMSRGVAGNIAKSTDCTVERVLEVAFPPDEVSPTSEKPGREGIRDREWEVLAASDLQRTSDFVARSSSLMSPELEGSAVFEALDALIAKVVLIDRLREVRALEGFRRIDPDPERPLVRPGLSDPPAWLPAVEVYGEGIFITLAEGPLRAWESGRDVVRRASALEARRAESFMKSRARKEATPRFLLLHTFAHLMIRQLAFECGYAAASLRERVYCRNPGAGGSEQAGILIYTAAGDVEGTLGGLVRQGGAPRLAETMIAALDAARWCSSDPICAESRGQGFDELNRAACHACALVAETSCEHGNILLDRAMVVGGEASEVPGFFEETLRLAVAESAADVSR
jgi:hypothetical protein